MNLRLATIIKPIHGKFTHWKVGQVVKARHIRGSWCYIERVKWKGKLQLTNSCAGVPRSALKFHDAPP
jgi:hypothetical protein